MSDDSRQAFYVGYAGEMPRSLAGFLRRRLAAGIAGAVAAGVAIAALQGPFPAAMFEYGTEREFVGWIRERPVPQLLVAGPDGATWSVYPLTEAGTKFGAERLVAGWDGAWVRARGTLIYRGAQTLLDLNPASLEPLEPAPSGRPSPRVEDLGHHRLVGELVDSKCHFGVMNPGSGKVHRACAARCISSGVPPMLWVRGARGPDVYLLVVGPQGEPLGRALLPYVAEPVAIAGRVTRLDHLLVLRTEPGSVRRL